MGDPLEHATSTRWSQRATEALRALAATGKPFTVDDLTHLAGRPKSKNAIGPVLAAAHKAGLIDKVGSANAVRRPRHGSSNYVWIGATPKE